MENLTTDLNVLIDRAEFVAKCIAGSEKAGSGLFIEFLNQMRDNIDDEW